MGEILLDWEGHNKALSNKLWEFFKEEYLVDFNVTCHGQQKKVHKFVLALLFPMLKESLWSTDPLILDRGEPVKDESSRMLWTPQCLNLDNIADHAEDMDYLIQFAYTGKTTVPNEHADCLVRISNNMDIQCLKDSLDRGATARSARKDQNEPTNTTLGRLRPRSHLKNIQVIEDSVSSYDEDEDDDDLDVHSNTDEESNQDNTEYSDGNDEISSSSEKKTPSSRNRIPKKRRRNDEEKKKRQNASETSEKLTETDSKGEADSGESSKTKTKVKEKKLLKCPQCDYIAKFPNRLLRHLGSHVRKQARDRKQFLCLFPEEKEKDEANGEASSNDQTTTPTTEEGSKPLKCPQCDYVAKYPNRLLRHLGSHVRKLARGPKLANTCKTCNKSFETRQLLEGHRDSKCGTEPLVCKYCGHKTSRKVILLQHMVAMHQVDANGNPLEKNLKCPDCDFVCYARHQLRAHERAKHERMGMFKCKECNYTAPYVKDVLRHERTKHQNISDYMCEECGYRYKSRGRLNRHVLVRHKGIKPHKCNICGAEYSDSLSFKIHMQRHEGKVEYKFVCHICGHNLRRKYELKTHMRKKHGIELQEESSPTNYPGPCQLQHTEKSTS